MARKGAPQAKPTLPEPGTVPVQARSKETVRAILEAAFELLADGGPEPTMEAIGMRAGVGPATLFRYFPDRTALLAGVADHAWEREGEAIVAVVSRAFELGYEDAAALIVKSALEMYVRLRRVHRAFMERIGPFSLNERYRGIFERVVDGVTRLIEAKRDAVRVDDPEVTAFIFVRGLAFVMETAAEAHPEWIESGRLQRAMTEHVLLVLRGRERTEIQP